MKGLVKQIERSYKERAPLYEELGIPMHSDPVWVSVVWKQIHPDAERDTSPLVEGPDE